MGLRRAQAGNPPELAGADLAAEDAAREGAQGHGELQGVGRGSISGAGETAIAGMRVMEPAGRPVQLGTVADSREHRQSIS